MSVERFGVAVDFLPNDYMPYYRWFKYLPSGMIEHIKKSLSPREIYPLDGMGWIISIPSFIGHGPGSDKIQRSADALVKKLDKLNISTIHLAKIGNMHRKEIAEILKKSGRQVLTYPFIKEMIALLYLVEVINKCGPGFTAQEIGIICRHETLKRDILYLIARYANYITSFESRGHQGQRLYNELFEQFGLVVHTTQNIESIINRCKIIILDTIPENQYLEKFDQTKVIVNLSGRTCARDGSFKGLWINDLFLQIPPKISKGFTKDFVGLEDLVWECILFHDKDFRIIYETEEIRWEHIIKLIRIINRNRISVKALQVNDRMLAYTGFYQALVSVI